MSDIDLVGLRKIADHLAGWNIPDVEVYGEGAHLVLRDPEADDQFYELASSTYYGVDTTPHSPFLEIVLEALQAFPALLDRIEGLEAELAEYRHRVSEALAIERWPYRPSTMVGYELDQAEGYNDARREFRRALGVTDDDE